MSYNVLPKGLVFEFGSGVGRTFSDSMEWLEADGSDLEDFSVRIDVFDKLTIRYHF